MPPNVPRITPCISVCITVRIAVPPLKSMFSSNSLAGLDILTLSGGGGTPYGTRTRVSAVKGRRPRPLDEGRSGGVCNGAAEGWQEGAGPRTAGDFVALEATPRQPAGEGAARRRAGPRAVSVAVGGGRRAGAGARRAAPQRARAASSMRRRARRRPPQSSVSSRPATCRTAPALCASAACSGVSATRKATASIEPPAPCRRRRR